MKETPFIKISKNKHLIITEQIITLIQTIVEETVCYNAFLPSSNIQNDKIAKKKLKTNPEKEGLISALSVVTTS